MGFTTGSEAIWCRNESIPSTMAQCCEGWPRLDWPIQDIQWILTRLPYKVKLWRTENTVPMRANAWHCKYGSAAVIWMALVGGSSAIYLSLQQWLHQKEVDIMWNRGPMEPVVQVSLEVAQAKSKFCNKKTWINHEKISSGITSAWHLCNII
jgi:hypothetical protein